MLRSRTGSARLIRRLLLAMALTWLGGAEATHADPLPERTTGLAFRERAVLVSVGLQDLFTPAARDRLTSGFSTRVLVRIQLSRQRTLEPVAIAFQRVEIIYDIWDERFRVRTTHGSGIERAFEVKTIDEVLRIATMLVDFPIELPEPLTPGERYTLAFRGDLNPLSPELMTEVRRWLRQPAGAQPRPGAGRGDSFFGTFVTVFVNPQIEDSERQVRFSSQSFEVPRR
jgi:hypothetical protein